MLAQAPEASGGPFEDPETRYFYETLPDLRGIIPAVLLGDAAKPATADEEPAGAAAATAHASDAGIAAAAGAAELSASGALRAEPGQQPAEVPFGLCEAFD